MPFKPTLMGNSSTLFSSDVSSPVVQSVNVGQQPYNPEKVGKLVDAATIYQPRQTTQQEIINMGTAGGGGGLSQRCYYCYNYFGPKMDLLMYRGLAFCKVECRKFQIELDREASRQHADLKKHMDDQEQDNNKSSDTPQSLSNS